MVAWVVRGLDRVAGKFLLEGVSTVQFKGYGAGIYRQVLCFTSKLQILPTKLCRQQKITQNKILLLSIWLLKKKLLFQIDFTCFNFGLFFVCSRPSPLTTVFPRFSQLLEEERSHICNGGKLKIKIPVRLNSIYKHKCRTRKHFDVEVILIPNTCMINEKSTLKPESKIF